MALKKYMVIIANVVVPGSGTLFAKRMTQGVLQLLIAMLALLLWSTISLRPVAVLLFAFAWIWAIFSALKYKREAEQIELHPVTIVEQQSRKRLG